MAVALAVHTKRVKKAKKAKVRMVMYDKCRENTVSQFGDLVV